MLNNPKMKCNIVTVTEIKYLKLVLNALVLTQFWLLQCDRVQCFVKRNQIVAAHFALQYRTSANEMHGNLGSVHTLLSLIRSASMTRLPTVLYSEMGK